MLTIKKQNLKAFSLVEVLLATALFGMMVTAIFGAIFYGLQSTYMSGTRNRAVALAEEGLEATRSIRDVDYAQLTNGDHGIVIASNKWSLTGTPDVTDTFYTRTINISTVSSAQKLVTSTVTWNQNLQRTGSITLTTYLTNWKLATVGNKGGVLVYGGGGTATDEIRYKTFDSTAKTWSAELTASDVDAGTTNKALRVAKIYSSSTRNEKVLITRHYDGTNQYIYGQVFDGTVWNTPQLLSTLNVNTFLDVQNFDGAYINNGDFVAVFSDNTTTPKFRVWNGTVWGSQTSTQNVGGIPNYIIAKARPGTNEIMVVTYDQLSDTNSEYFYIGANNTYETADWTLHTEHATVSPINSKRLIDFDWNTSTPTKGLFVYSNNSNDRSTRYKVFTANGTGSGSWSNTVNGANQGKASTRLGVLETISRPTTQEFISCSQNTSPQIICYRADVTSSPAITLTNPTNQTIAATVDTGIQKAFDLGYETQGGTYGVSVYSDATITPKLKKYNPATNTFDASATNMSNLTGTLKTVRIIPQTSTNDMIITLADSNRTLYTIFWDGTNHVLYSSADALGFNTHGANGSAPEEYWYDFGWDNF